MTIYGTGLLPHIKMTAELPIYLNSVISSGPEPKSIRMPATATSFLAAENTHSSTSLKHQPISSIYNFKFCQQISDIPGRQTGFGG